jgi:putative redox protein
MQERMHTHSEVTEAGEPGIVIVHGATTGFVQDIVVGPHHLAADEPVAFGGTDRGPSPYDFLLVAPGS